MKRFSLATVIASVALFFSLAGAAQAHGLAAGKALLGLRSIAQAADASQATCPAGAPVQTLTVVNEANVRPWALERVESAVVAQSLQLRAAWGTPCVQFGPGGWPIQLLIGGEPHGVHWPGPYAQVWTGGATYIGWSQSFSHEVIEMLVDPTTSTYYTYDDIGAQLEVADPVEEHAYMLGGTWVSDFTLPAYFAGATLGVCETTLTGQECDGPLIAAAASAGPYDEMRALSAPWSGEEDDGS